MQGWDSCRGVYGVYARSCPVQIQANASLAYVTSVKKGIAYGFSAPIGLLYDRWGAMVVGTAGAFVELGISIKQLGKNIFPQLFNIFPQ